ncbi:MAG: MBL fold metallo-hydrolase [Bacteroidales bacterium]|nr:MBL fold metallo-hydrolase [Bacteroidales bacterium]
MKNWVTKKGNKIIQVLSGRSNVYLMLKDNVAIMVDTGKTSTLKTLSKKMNSLNIAIDDISYILLTHTHFDHCQLTKKIKEISGCKIIVSSAAEDSIRNGYTKLPDGTFLVTKLIAKFGRLMSKAKFGYEPFRPDIFVNGDYDLKIGDSEIKIIKTTGHSADSVSILVDNDIAIVGDVMFGVFKNYVFPPYSDDTLKMIESWDKLLNTDCRIFLPGHGKEISRNLLQKEYEKYARKHNKRYSP